MGSCLNFAYADLSIASLELGVKAENIIAMAKKTCSKSAFKVGAKYYSRRHLRTIVETMLEFLPTLP